MSSSPDEESASRRGFAHALREVRRGLALAVEHGLTPPEILAALSRYEDAVAA